MKLAIAVSFFAIALATGADPIFNMNTFHSNSEGWQPWGTVTNSAGISADNPYLLIDAGGFGKKGRMITFNWEDEWTGNYISSGVTGIRLDLANLGNSDDVYLRVAIGNRASPQQPGGTWWISDTAIFIPTETDWQSYFLPISEENMLVVGNIEGESDNESFNDTLSNVGNIRILTSSFPTGAIGDEFFGEVGIDNVALVPEPTTLPLIGSGVLLLLLYRNNRRSNNPSFRGLKKISPDQ